MSFGPEVPVVLVASSFWDSPARLNAHHVATRLADRGHRVLFVESTGLRAPAPGAGHDWRRILGRLRDWSGGLRSPRPGLHVLAPLALPGAGRGGLGRLSRRLLRAQIERAVRRLSLQGAVLWAFLPTAAPLVRASFVRAAVYHCVDHYAANPGVDAAAIEEAEGEMLAAADLVFATSEVLAQRLARTRPDVRCMPNVADARAFVAGVDAGPGEPAALRGLGRPRVLFAGNLAGYRVDLALLQELVARRRDLFFVLLGPRGLGDAGATPEAMTRLLRESNVRAIDPVPYASLPAWLAHCDVGLIPFQVNDHTRGSLPLKLFEYLAAGLPVVATDLPNLRPHAAPGVLALARDAEGFSRALDAALAAPPEARERRRALALRNDWEARMEALCAAVGAALATPL